MPVLHNQEGGQRAGGGGGAGGGRLELPGLAVLAVFLEASTWA